MSFLPTPRQYLIWSAAVIFPTIVIGTLAFLVSNATNSEFGRVLEEVFWIDGESNVPTFVNFSFLILASAFMALASVQAFSTKDQWRWHWLGLAALFLFAGFDEAAQVHEAVGTYLTNGIEGSGLFAWEWVIYGFAAVVVLFLLGFRFLVSGMDPAPRRYLIVGVLFYLGGALGLEMIQAFLWFHDMENGRFVLIAEEAFEMFGAALFGATGLRQLTLRTDGEGEGFIKP